MMSIAALLQAAEFLERREREAEHGYASTMPVHEDHPRRKTKSKKSQGNRVFKDLEGRRGKKRSTHNELEKNRRAHLRHCLEKLKEMVPLGPESSRHTTLGLLTKAKQYIKSQEEKERRLISQREHLRREQRFLKRKLNLLTTSSLSVTHKRRSISECSSATSMYTNSSSMSETDEIDIIGYNSNQSDTDDHSSIQSLTSDGGVVINTKRLSLGEQVTI